MMLVAGLLIFLGMHSLAIVSNGTRERAVATFGALPWKLFYSAVSLLGLFLVARGYVAARQDPVLLYEAPYWMRFVTGGLMALVFPLLLAAYLPGRIQRTVKHPMLAATAVWAFAHLLSNGTLADALLFGGFLAWAVLNSASAAWRPVRPVFLNSPARRWNDAVAVAVGLLLYFVMMHWLHARLIGVPPMPL